MPGGDLLILERRFSWLCARHTDPPAGGGRPRAGRTVDGEAIFYADFGQQIDNFEALGVHRGPAGETVLTLVSDDNFSPLQRTLLMQFTMLE